MSFLVSLANYSLRPNGEIKQKLLFYSCRLAGWFVWYEITKGFRPWEEDILLVLSVWGIYISLSIGFISTVFNGTVSKGI